MFTTPLPPVCDPATAVVTVTASTASWRGVTDAKNESLLRRKLSLLLMPSIVMLTNDSGRPLMRASRLVVATLTPGRNVTAFSALRVGVGMRLSWSELSVDETVAVCVLISSALLLTVTVSEIWPTSSTAFTDTGTPGATSTLATEVLKPVSETVTVYLPAPTAGTLNTPSELLTVSNVAPALLFTMTDAPGIAPPALSTTVPEMEPADCANAAAGASTSASANQT